MELNEMLNFTLPDICDIYLLNISDIYLIYKLLKLDLKTFMYCILVETAAFIFTSQEFVFGIVHCGFPHAYSVFYTELFF